MSDEEFWMCNYLLTAFNGGTPQMCNNYADHAERQLRERRERQDAAESYLGDFAEDTETGGCFEREAEDYEEGNSGLGGNH